jgi:hypothetical protein
MRTSLAAACLVALTFSAGCSDAPAAKPVLASAAPVVSVRPAAPTPQGAADFASFWFFTLNRAISTGDTAALRALSHPDCPGCNAYTKWIEEQYAKGGLRGGVFTVLAAEALEDDPEAAVVRLTYSVTATEQLAKDGSVTGRLQAYDGVVGTMTLTRAADAWVVRELSGR